MGEVVRLMRRHCLFVVERSCHLRRDVLDQRAAGRDVQHLDAAANREDRQATRAGLADQLDLELVPLGGDLHDRRMHLLPVARRRDIVAPGQKESVSALERVGHTHRGVDHADVAARVKNRLLVVFEPVARGNRNICHGYIRVGTSIPIR
jgi:hypothetical protein